jgi:hypothetical protein
VPPPPSPIPGIDTNKKNIIKNTPNIDPATVTPAGQMSEADYTTAWDTALGTGASASNSPAIKTHEELKMAMHMVKDDDHIHIVTDMLHGFEHCIADMDAACSVGNPDINYVKCGDYLNHADTGMDCWMMDEMATVGKIRENCMKCWMMEVEMATVGKIKEN